MTRIELKRDACRRLNRLPPDQLKAASFFLAYLEESASDEATAELLRIPGFLRSFRRSQEEVRQGKVTPVEQLKRKYRRV